MKENWHIMHFRQTNPIFLSQINGGAKPWQPQGENGGGPGVRLNQLQWPLTVDPLGPMPSDQTELMDAALQRSLPEVQKLYRYERRALA